MSSATPGCAGELPTPPVALKWRDLVAGSPLNAGAGLVLQIKSQVPAPADAVISYEITVADRFLQGSLPPATNILPGATRNVTLNLPALTAPTNLATMEFSAQLVVNVDVELDSGVDMGRATVAHIFFHRTSTGILYAYDRATRASLYRAGDIHNRHARRLPPSSRPREGFVYGGHGLPPHVVAALEAGDPAATHGGP